MFRSNEEKEKENKGNEKRTGYIGMNKARALGNHSKEQSTLLVIK